MDKFLTFTIIGVCAAGTFAIAASGLVLTYTTTGIFNFAHGAIAMLGAFAYWQIRSPEAWGWPAPIAAFIVLFVLAPLLGILLEVGIMRGLQDTSETTKLVVSISLLAAFLGLGRWIWPEDDPHPISKFFDGNTAHILGVNIDWHDLIALFLAILVAIGLRLLLYRTRAGIAMRASVDDRPLSALNGARPDRSAMLAWAIGCSLAALAGILMAPVMTLSHTVLTLLVVNAYAAAMLGRLRSLPLTFLGALILGLADAYATGYLPTGNQYLTGLRPAIPVILLFIVLILIPSARLRGQSATRTREVVPRVSWRGTFLGCAVLIAVTAVVAQSVSLPNAQTLLALFGVGLVALSLVPLVGYAGQISLCQMSFAAIGAMAMNYHGGGGNGLGLVYAAVITGLVGALIALPAIRLQGIYLALATGAFAVVMDRWIFIMPNIDVGPWTLKFFGSNNLNVQPLHLPFVDTTQPRTQLVMLSVVFCLFWLVVVAIRRGPFGERLLAMKDSPAACATMGMNVTAAKLMVFAISAAMAGVGGAFYAAALGGVANSNFDFFASLPVLLLAVVGGIGTAGGALFAGIIQVGLPLVLAPVAALAEPLKLLPGLMGIGLGRNPNGVTGDMREQFQPLWRARAVMVGLAVVLAGLFVLYKTDVISGWNFGIVAVLCTFAAPLVAKSLTEVRRERTGRPLEIEWETVGIERPYTEDDLVTLDRALALPRSE